MTDGVEISECRKPIAKKLFVRVGAMVRWWGERGGGDGCMYFIRFFLRKQYREHVTFDKGMTVKLVYRQKSSNDE